MRIKGGLGNQLFQYAAAYALSKRLKQKFVFDHYNTNSMTKREYKLKELNVDNNEIISSELLPRKIILIRNMYVNKALRLINYTKHKCGDYIYLIENGSDIQKDFFSIEEQNIYLDGYFQSEMYFKNFRPQIIKQFTPAYVSEKAYFEVLDHITSTNSVAIHVRRGDFKNDNNPYHYILNEEYYQNAIQYVNNNIESPFFFWFSDDIEWVKEKIGIKNNYRFIKLQTNHSDIDEMLLMKNCNHIITANSTFSWWSAWLSDKRCGIKVVPKKPYGMKYMIPENWIKI